MFMISTMFSNETELTNQRVHPLLSLKSLGDGIPSTPNKAQEIQGAILPLAEKYQWSSPFLGAVLAGVFTEGSVGQLRSLGFNILYFPYDTLVAAFAQEGIHIAFDETTPDTDFRQCVKTIESATESKMKESRTN